MDERHIALPKLYGAPAYARPPRQVDEAPKPFDPDELPIAAYRTDEEHDFVEALPPEVFAPGGSPELPANETRRVLERPETRPRGLRALADRLLGGS